MFVTKQAFSLCKAAPIIRRLILTTAFTINALRHGLSVSERQDQDAEAARVLSTEEPSQRRTKWLAIQ
jgi:hypothetical protein